MLLSVHLLGKNLNIHAKPEKNADHQGIQLALKSISSRIMKHTIKTKKHSILISQVLKAVNMNITVFCDVTHHRKVDGHHSFRTC